VLDRAYACENAVSKEKTCTFRVSKTILHREIPKEQVQKLITTGKTDLLPKFVSKKGRPFSAHLKLENGKVGFEFAARKPKKTAPHTAAAAGAPAPRSVSQPGAAVSQPRLRGLAPPRRKVRALRTATTIPSVKDR